MLFVLSHLQSSRKTALFWGKFITVEWEQESWTSRMEVRVQRRGRKEGLENAENCR